MWGFLMGRVLTNHSHSFVFINYLGEIKMRNLKAFILAAGLSVAMSSAAGAAAKCASGAIDTWVMACASDGHGHMARPACCGAPSTCPPDNFPQSQAETNLENASCYGGGNAPLLVLTKPNATEGTQYKNASAFKAAIATGNATQGNSTNGGATAAGKSSDATGVSAPIVTHVQ